MASYISLTNLIYPVGAYYMSDSSTSPASLFGGAWSALTGRFLYCNNGTGTGGSNTHTLTTSEMPSHNHTVGFDLDVSYSSGSTRYSPHSAGASSAGYRFNSSWTGGGLLTTICQHIRRAIVGGEPLNICWGEA